MENILALARSTSTDELCTLWGLSASSVRARKKGKRPMTISEVGALADIYGAGALLEALHGPGEYIPGRNI